MRKILLWIFSAFLFTTLPAFAQHGGHASGGGRGFSGGHQVHSEVRSGGARGYRGEGRETAHYGYHYSQGSGRAYWHGGRFDRDYFVGHWGVGNRFYFGRCNWWGPRFGVGSYFWYNGAYFTIIDPVPAYWYDDEVYVDWVDDYGYVLINPTFPGVYYHVGVRF